MKWGGVWEVVSPLKGNLIEWWLCSGALNTFTQWWSEWPRTQYICLCWERDAQEYGIQGTWLRKMVMSLFKKKSFIEDIYTYTMEGVYKHTVDTFVWLWKRQARIQCKTTMGSWPGMQAGVRSMAWYVTGRGLYKITQQHGIFYSIEVCSVLVSRMNYVMCLGRIIKVLVNALWQIQNATKIQEKGQFISYLPESALNKAIWLLPLI